MPHGLLKDLKSQLPQFVAQQMGAIKAAIIAKIEERINEIIDELLDQCPPPEILERLTKTVTSLKKVLVSFDSKIDKFKQIPRKLDKPIKAAKVVVEILSHMPLPSAIGTPPGPAGGLIVAVPTGVIQAQSNTLVFMRDTVNNLEADQKAINSLFGSTDGILNPIKAKIAQIETLLQRCAENPDLADDDRRKILEAAGALENDSVISDITYTGSNGGTYTIKIINSEEDNLIAPRRRAIALDNRGIVVIKGPLSFAGDPNILVDELKLRLEKFLNPTIEIEDRLIITTAPKAPIPIQTAPEPTSTVKPAPAQQFVYDLSGLDLSFKTFLREKGYRDYVRTGLFQRKRAKTIKRASDKERREYELWKTQKQNTEKERQRAQQMLDRLN